MTGPELYPAGPLQEISGRPSGRRINRSEAVGWNGVVLSEWELSHATWTDRHQHDEFNFILAGELEVECDGVTVVAGPGDVVRVPPGTTGRYTAPRYARMIAVYGPNPTGQPPTVLGFESR